LKKKTLQLHRVTQPFRQITSSECLGVAQGEVVQLFVKIDQEVSVQDVAYMDGNKVFVLTDDEVENPEQREPNSKKC